MKILMVSMFSNHFFRWTEQLRGSGHEIYWIDVYDSNTKVEKIDFVHQIIGWRNKIEYPGRYWIKQYIPKLYNLISRINQRELAQIFESKLLEIKPDLVHSFVMYSACVPIYKVMQKYSNIKWMFSAWGNDLFFYQNDRQRLLDMKLVLPELDYMFADCERDFAIAKKLGFKGEFQGVFPGGGGYKFEYYDPYIKSFSERKIILIKGYQHKFGRCNKVLEAVSTIQNQLSNYEIIVFAASPLVLDYAKKMNLNDWKNLTIHGQLAHSEVLRLMGKSLIYIGNSISDGMPNTLLEAIIMGVFPIQSNPGGATAELINDGENGFLISNPENADGIRNLIVTAISNVKVMEMGVANNYKKIKPTLKREFIKQQVINKYLMIEKSINK
jgi:glycosyltransferase involved in cell wall biosynthesis